MKVLWFLFIPILFCCLQCEEQPKPAPVLPEITTEGKNTFGMRVNGEIWLPGKDHWSTYSIKGVSFWSGAATIYASRDFNKDSIYENFDIRFRQPIVTSEKTYRISSEYTHTDGEGVFTNHSPGFCQYKTDSIITGTLTILRLDSVNKIMSGTFEMQLTKKRGDCVDTIKITDGRFDLKMYN